MNEENANAMKLKLQYEKTISEVKKEFTQVFPQLKVEFCTTEEQNTVATHAIPDTTALGDITGVLKEGTVELTSNTPLKEIEKVLQQQYCLPVQICYMPA
jgi:hypothetical protein